MRAAGVFRAAEMIEMAIQLEENGQAFYAEAAARAEQPEVKELLEALAGQELRHQQRFRAMLPEEKEHRPGEEYAGERAAFIQALVEERLLPSEEVVEQVLPALSTDADVLDFALGFEKDTILFYYEMRHLMSDTQKPIIDDILAEERKHVELLRRLCQRCRLEEQGTDE